ncbi:WD domain protein, partial [Teratosphaeriaceae sp. CCFEE 6253]
MSIETHDEQRRQSPKRKRSSSPANGIPQADGAGDAAALQYAYDEELPPSEVHTPDEAEEEGVAAKRQRLERPKILDYVPHMTLRGHKRGVAAVKFSPDGA